MSVKKKKQKKKHNSLIWIDPSEEIYIRNFSQLLYEN